MNEVWMLDYLHAVFPKWGVFQSERHARIWIMEHDPENAHCYRPFKLTVNSSGLSEVPTTAPERKYAVQK